MAKKEITVTGSTDITFMAFENKESFLEVYKENIGSSQMSEFDLPRVGMPSGKATVWSVPGIEGEEHLNEISGIILHWKETRARWEKPFDEGRESPICTSLDATTGEGAPGGACATCPYAQWGTAVKRDGTFGRGQACQLKRHYFILQNDQLLPIVLSLSPGSVKSAMKYHMGLTSRCMSFFTVVTSFQLIPAQNEDGIDYAQAKLALAKKLSDEEIQMVRDYMNIIKPSLESVKIEHDDTAVPEPKFEDDDAPY